MYEFLPKIILIASCSWYPLLLQIFSWISGSTVPTLKFGDPFSHLLVTSHECEFAEENLEEISTLNRKSEDSYKNLDIDAQGQDEHTTSITSKQTINGGSLFSYRVPNGKNAWKTEPWTRSVIATGFHVRGQIGNIINPGGECDFNKSFE